MSRNRAPVLAGCALALLSVAAVTGVTLVPASDAPYQTRLSPGAKKRMVLAVRVADDGAADTLTAAAFTANGSLSGLIETGYLWIVPTATGGRFDPCKAPDAMLAVTPGAPVTFGTSGLSKSIRAGDLLCFGVDVTPFPTVAATTSPTPVGGFFSLGVGSLTFGTGPPAPLVPVTGPVVLVQAHLPTDGDVVLFLDRNEFATGGRVSIRFALKNATATTEEVRVRILDQSGARVRTELDCKLLGGWYVSHWDGRGDEGRFLGSGQYYVNVEAVALQGVGTSVQKRRLARKKVGFVR